MSADLLPPYGLFPEPVRNYGEGDGSIPEDWPGYGTSSGEQSFRKWRETQLRAISNNLWPEWVDGKGWKGAAASFSRAMTEREIEIMITEFSKSDILKQIPKFSKNNFSHFDHFIFEDDRNRRPGKISEDFINSNDIISIGSNFFHYNDSPVTESEKKNFLDILKASYKSKTNRFYFWFKSRLMRPRPYQASLIFTKRDFSSLQANSAVHSAIVSGHAVSGIMIRCGALEKWLDSGNVSAQRVKAFSQYMVDVGDRRVFAGVHYPTDNISSWCLALSLIPHVFRHADEIGAIVRQAIVDHSLVYSVVDQHYRNDSNLAHTVDFLNLYMSGGA